MFFACEPYRLAVITPIMSDATDYCTATKCRGCVCPTYRRPDLLISCTDLRDHDINLIQSGLDDSGEINGRSLAADGNSDGTGRDCGARIGFTSGYRRVRGAEADSV